MSSNTDFYRQYIVNFKIREWTRRSLSEINRHASDYGNKISQYKFNTCISHYFLDIVNAPYLRDDIYAGLVERVSILSGMNKEKVEEILNSVHKSINISGCKRHTIEYDPRASTLSVGVLRVRVPRSFFERVKKDDTKLAMMVLRYGPLDPNSGMFWSIDPKLMRLLSNQAALGLEESDSLLVPRDVEMKQNSNSSYPTLECFASPFNYNLNDFCSAFDDDSSLGYPEGVTCYGNFFDYIEQVGDVPIRMIVNPPYTDRLINRTAVALDNYMLRCNGDAHLIIVLPNWKSKGIDTMLEMKGSVSRVLEYGTFVFYDAIEEKLIKPKGKSIRVIVNISSNAMRSEKMLNSIVEYMRHRSSDVRSD